MSLHPVTVAYVMAKYSASDAEYVMASIKLHKARLLQRQPGNRTFVHLPFAVFCSVASQGDWDGDETNCTFAPPPPPYIDDRPPSYETATAQVQVQASSTAQYQPVIDDVD